MSLYCLKNASLYAPEPVGRTDLLIANDKIAAIGADLAERFSGVKVIDCEGKILIPGLIDQHVHITGGGGESGFASKTPELQVTDCIESGVTTVVGLLGTDGASRSVENLVAKAKGLRQEGITAYCLTGSYALPSVTLTGSVEKDVLFIKEILGVKVAISDHRSSNPKAEDLIRLGCMVRTAGLISGKAGVVHMHTGRGKLGVIPVLDALDQSDLPIFHFRPTHISRQPGTEEFARRGGYLDVTADADEMNEVIEDLLYWMERTEKGKLTLSSDANGSVPIWNEKKELIGMGVSGMKPLWRTIQILIREKGMPIETAISLVTSNVADALMLPSKGRVKEGADADMILLNEDLEMDLVIARGTIAMEHGIRKIRNFYSC